MSDTQTRLFRFRPLTPMDLDLVTGWMQQRHAARWCAQGRGRSQLELDLMERMESDWLFPHLALLGNKPAGYLQYYVAGIRQAELRLDDGHGLLGIDFCIGEPDLLRRGLGTLGLRHAAEMLFREPAIRALVADPHAANIAAIKTYERAGFRLVPGTPLTANGGVLLRLVRPPSPAPSPPPAPPPSD
jgi:RimJ/RimL family protein N-acetyltransferase